jgi:ParB family chromosome partitioning protein
MMEMALIENLQRVQLNPIEEALAFEALINEYGMTHEELADQMGKSRSAVTNTLRLLKLDPEVRSLIQSGKLTAGHGRALLQADPVRQVKLARKIVEDQMNVRTVEQTGSSTKKKDKPAKAPSPNVGAFLDKLRHLLGTKVVMKGTENKGVLEIHYMNRQDLDTLGELLQRGYDAVHGN